jgi:hypothetical protein
MLFFIVLSVVVLSVIMALILLSVVNPSAGCQNPKKKKSQIRFLMFLFFFFSSSGILKLLSDQNPTQLCTHPPVHCDVESHYGKCTYYQCHYTESQTPMWCFSLCSLSIFQVSLFCVIILSAIMLNVIMVSVIVLIVMAPLLHLCLEDHSKLKKIEIRRNLTDPFQILKTWWLEKIFWSKTVLPTDIFTDTEYRRRPYLSWPVCRQNDYRPKRFETIVSVPLNLTIKKQRIKC